MSPVTRDPPPPTCPSLLLALFAVPLPPSPRCSCWCPSSAVTRAACSLTSRARVSEPGCVRPASAPLWRATDDACVRGLGRVGLGSKSLRRELASSSEGCSPLMLRAELPSANDRSLAPNARRSRTP
eukprot:368718-Rhodomonas_salina.2